MNAPKEPSDLDPFFVASAGDPTVTDSLEIDTPPDRHVAADLVRHRPYVSAAAQTPPVGNKPPNADRVMRLPSDEPWTRLLAVPVAMLIGLLLTYTDLGFFLVAPAHIQIHELGHASISWLTGRPALPLPCGLTITTLTPSFWVTPCVLFLIGVFTYRSHRESKYIAVGVGALLILAAIGIRYLLSDETALMWITAGGFAGELWISALLVIAFFFEGPDRLRWDFFRFLVLVPAAASWVRAAKLWVGIARGDTPLPIGTFLGSRGDGQGDLDRLLGEYNWPLPHVIGFYRSMVGFSGIAILSVTVFFMIVAARQLKEQRS